MLGLLINNGGHMHYDLESPWGGLLGWEHKTAEECEAAAQEWFARSFDDEPMRNGDSREEDTYIVGIDDDGEEATREPVTLFYEYYHGDFAEHNTAGM